MTGVAQADQLTPNLSATVYYHVAPTEQREAILKHGIDYKRAEEMMWGEYSNGEQGNYLWDDLETAQNYADQVLLDPSDIWEVRGEGLSVIPDPSIKPDHPEHGTRWQRHAYMSVEPISPERIKVVDHDWDQLEYNLPHV